MRAEPAEVGSYGFDSLQFSSNGTASQAKALAGHFRFFVGYLGAVTPQRLSDVLGSGLAFLPVTFGNSLNGPLTVSQCQKLGLPQGTTVFLDFEGKAQWDAGPASIATVKAWAKAVEAAGFEPGLYCGTPQPLTSSELWKLPVKRYWRGQGRIVDRSGALSEPLCGWCCTQAFPSKSVEGVLVDCNLIGQDYLGRVPTWVVES